MQRKVQLRLIVTHAVCAIRTSSSILVDARAVLAVLLAADEAEHVAVVLLVRGIGNDAAERLGHAVAELGVGSGGEGAGLCFPFAGGDFGAGCCSGVGGGVGVHFHARGVHFGDFLGEVIEVFVRGDFAVVDGCEACGG